MKKANKAITYIDLFAGAGGLSEGFAKARYKSVAHVEMDEDACNTLKTRECYYYLKRNKKLSLYNSYLKKAISREELYSYVPKKILKSVICETMSSKTMTSIFNKIDENLATKKLNGINLIVGGPPCQAYSMIGRSRKNMDNDPRNMLYVLYHEVIKRYNPDMFVFENVPGLLTAGRGKHFKSIIDGFEGLNYETDYCVLNASDYGVLQKRKRLIIIGWRGDTLHCFPELKKEKKKYTVSEILCDLPKIQPGESADKYASSPSDYLKVKKIRRRNDILTWHETRSISVNDRKIYKLIIKAWDSERKRLKYTDIPKKLITHNNTSSFLDRFKVVAKEECAAQTMVAHISKDGHYFIHPDLEQARSISVREAARIQSFPDNYFFEGSRTEAFKQIGNAVPPLLAYKIAKALKKQFKR